MELATTNGNGVDLHPLANGGMTATAADRSAARQRLASLQEEISASAAECARLQTPVDRARADLSEAERLAREIEQERSSIDAEEVDTLVATAKTGDKSGDKLAKDFARRRADLERRAADANHKTGLARRVLLAVCEPHNAHVAQLRDLRLGLAALIADVAVDLHSAAMARRNAALAEALAAEVEARSLCMAIAEEGHRLQAVGVDPLPVFRVSGPMAERFVKAPRYDAPSPQALYAGAAKWCEWLGRIQNDPDA
jgi:chromosome segregation ATPase